MRIAVLGSGTAAKTLPPHLAALADATTTVDLINARLVTFPATPYQRLIVDLGYVDAIEQADRAGYDAVVINSFADYGIAAARATTNMLVLGAGEAALGAATELGPRFSIVTIWPQSMVHLYAERLQALHVTNNCVRIRHVGQESDLTTLGHDDSVMAKLQRQADDILQRVTAQCRAAIENDDIQSVVLGCTCMAPIAARLAAELRFPVLEGSRLALTRAKSLLADAKPRSAQSLGPGRAGTLIGDIVDAWVDRGGNVEASRPGAAPSTTPANGVSLVDAPDSATTACSVCAP
jgi:allantoin racemase